MHDRLSAWLVAGILGYLLVFQGVVSAYALTSMAADNPGTNVICTYHGVSTLDQELADLSPECCLSLCQIACATGAMAEPAGVSLTLQRRSVQLGQPKNIAPLKAPIQLGLIAEARAPPAFS